MPWEDRAPDRRTVGSAGEALAIRHLRAAGYTILEHGWRCGSLGEIDLIARHGQDLVFVEVRARRGAEPGAALESIGRRKQAKIARLAQEYLNRHSLKDISWRIDVVAIAFMPGKPAQVDIVQNAIGW